MGVEVKIGTQSVPREIVVETDTPAAEVEAALAAALADTEGTGLFVINVRGGGRILVPASKIAYVEFTAAEARRVGFGNIV